MPNIPCNMNCFKCEHLDCINNEVLTPQLEHYYLARMKTADKRERTGRKQRKKISEEEKR